ncbi:MAG: hypothetical protein NTZ46_05805 [Verrucomicrobia bacterium]|nr:hypothetical protein [Verrucomicrobiota bacterium]
MKHLLLILACSLSGLSMCAADAPLAKPPFTPAVGAQGQRREEVMKELAKNPYPKTGGWHFVGKALASYWVGKSADGDAAILAMKSQAEDAGGGGEEMGFHWKAFQIARIVFLFGREGVFAPGRMSPEAEKTAKELLWAWLEPRGRAVLVEPSKDWWIWGSENHHLQAWFSMWGALSVLDRDPAYVGRIFADGMTLPQLKKGCNEYFKRWIRNRATRGLFVECGSTYAKYSLSGFYNFVDFADDPELRGLAKQFLDLCWTQWALEQIDGMRAGSRHRIYPGEGSERQGAATETAAYHFGGIGKNSMHPSVWCAATSSYTPPALVQEIVHRRAELGNYQITSRQPGLLDASSPAVENFVEDPKYPMYQPGGITKLDPACPSMLRRTYATPGFILGATMLPALPFTAWAAISSQNRWDGVLFTGKDSPRIFVQPKRPAKGSLYNTQWSVMDQGVLIIQRLKMSKAANTSRIFFSQNLPRTEKNGWIFVEAQDAYAAVKVAEGGWKWEPDSAEYWREVGKFKPRLGEWLAPEKEFAPIVFEVVPKKAFPGFAAFQNAITSNRLTQGVGRLDYTSVFYKTTLTLFTDYKQPPLIGGKPVNFETPMSFDGPVLQSEFGGATVQLKAFGQKYIFSF